MIDLRSDTVTRPTKEMLEFMFSASVGDDVFGEDPAVNQLEEKVAAMFGKEAAMFCPSGTMTNQIALKVHTQPGDEVICDKTAHIYNFEGGGIAFNSGASVRLLNGENGIINAQQVKENINDPENIHMPYTRLVAMENTTNKGGGSYYKLEEIKAIHEVCQNHSLSMHLDGARLFNALVETNETTEAHGQYFDSISICLSKGLGAPAGSVLTASREFIKKARRIRKLFGGAMRQAGYLAAAGIYALDNNISRLKEDHNRAKEIARFLTQFSFIKEIIPVQTNIIIFSLEKNIDPKQFINYLNSLDIKVVYFGGQKIRMVTHMDFTDTDMEQLFLILRTNSFTN